MTIPFLRGSLLLAVRLLRWNLGVEESLEFIAGILGIVLWRRGQIEQTGIRLDLLQPRTMVWREDLGWLERIRQSCFEWAGDT